VKTLHLTNAWHASSGGIGTFYRALIDAGNRARHEVRLVVPGDLPRVEDVGEFGRIYTIAAPRAPLNRNYRILYPHRFLFPNTAIQDIINQEKPDLIEISEKYTMPYLAGLLRTARLPGVNVHPTVVGLSCERMDENVAAYITRSRIGEHFCRLYMKWIYFPMFDHHIAVSEHTAGELLPASRGHKVRRGVWVLPMGVDTDRFSPDKRTARDRMGLLRRIGASDDITVLLYAGRLAPEKNLTLLTETMAQLRKEKFRLVVAGDGIERQQLEKRCRQEGLAVSFLGHVSDAGELAALFANADIFLHPNPREPFGIAPLESMAAGLALVAPTTGGITSYANNENAWLTPATSDCFAEQVRKICKEPDLRERRTACARRTAMQYQWSTVTRQFLSLYHELHAVTLDKHLAPARPARTYSTPGDLFGREIQL
jgi:alpha-1,6-mannosyltransferase